MYVAPSRAPKTSASRQVGTMSGWIPGAIAFLMT